MQTGYIAFFNHRKVRGNIPKRVQKIGAESFLSLGAESFSTPMAIESEEPSQLVAIGERAFEFANNVLKLPESLETIGNRAFANLAGTTATSSFMIPGKVKNIGKYLFIPYSGTANITGTLTIASPYLTKANLGINLFMYANRRGGGFHPGNFTTIQLHKAV